MIQSRIRVELQSLSLGNTYSVFNMYGPYGNRKKFWKKCFEQKSLKAGNVTVGGDLNFTANRGEVW